jgi:ribosomal protein L37AE/L43A
MAKRAKRQGIVRADCGFYQCDKCGHIEDREAEVKCWECSEGEMVWQTYPVLVTKPVPVEEPKR